MLERPRPMRFPTVFTIERKIMQRRRSCVESPPRPASFMIDGP